MSFIVTHYSQLNKPLESYIAVGGKSSMTTVKALWDPSSPQSLISAETIDLINPLQKSKEKFVSKDIIIERYGKYYGNDNDTKDSGRCSRT